MSSVVYCRLRPESASTHAQLSVCMPLHEQAEAIDGCVVLCSRVYRGLSASSEAFYRLRHEFAVTHAQLCISHYVLGIGDRHLSNFMIDLHTGAVVGIDFGHAFGSATQVTQPPLLLLCLCLSSVLYNCLISNTNIVQGAICGIDYSRGSFDVFCLVLVTCCTHGGEISRGRVN